MNIKMPKISHYNTFYILRYAYVRYVKCVFTNIRHGVIVGPGPRDPGLPPSPPKV